jgi:hypothetical protein
VPQVTTNIMALHAVPKSKSKSKTKTLKFHSHLLSLKIDIHGSNLLTDFSIYFLTKLASKEN